MDNDGFDLPSWWVPIELAILLIAVVIGLWAILEG